ncbi:uncharacterized protein LOC118110380 [Hippoglossus stenolepis]|uniref:uncharacterized protein LOC118110380 n=1 Tax=Hippoglossus stenolepis TaxID=195615 RepID=UPI00159C1EE2|nr:uncharacterized protein LOC118110380 [Hippoglossus stenolepis]
MKKGNTQSMDSLNRLEIFIPEEADAKTIRLCSLPAVLLKRMGLPLHDSKDSKKLAIWISPAVLRRKGQKLSSNTGKDALENVSSLLGRRFRPLMGPFKMPISSTNRAICNMLKDMNQGKTCKSPTPLCPRDSPLQTGFPAIVIYHGCIYLCISKNNPSKSRQDTPSTHSLSSESQKKELHNDKRPRKMHTTNKNVPSSKAARSVRQSADSGQQVDGHSHKDAAGQQAAEEAAAAPEPAWFHPEGGQEVGANEDSGNCEMQDLASDEAERTSQKDEGVGDVHMERGAVTHNSNQSCTGRESLGATSLVRECDFDELVQEEKIASMKARLRLSEAALNSLHSSQ